MRTAMAAVAAMMVTAATAGPDEGGARPAAEEIDRVQSRLARQDRAANTLVGLIEKLRVVAPYRGAALALLNTEGEPADRLREALLALERRPATPAAGAEGGGAQAPGRPGTRTAPWRVVYAQAADEDRGRAAKAVVSDGERSHTLGEGAGVAERGGEIRIDGIEAVGAGLRVRYVLDGRRGEQLFPRGAGR